MTPHATRRITTPFGFASTADPLAALRAITAGSRRSGRRWSSAGSPDAYDGGSPDEAVCVRR
jgi:hypothetical protein